MKFKGVFCGFCCVEILIFVFIRKNNRYVKDGERGIKKIIILFN